LTLSSTDLDQVPSVNQSYVKSYGIPPENSKYYINKIRGKWEKINKIHVATSACTMCNSGLLKDKWEIGI
jgi:hypothetical protein